MTPQSCPYPSQASEADIDGTVRGPNVARRAILWMVAATVELSVLPLIIWFGVRDMSPFMFVAVWYVVSVACQATIRQVQARFDEIREQNDGTETGKRDTSRLVMLDDLKKVKPRYFGLAAATWLQWLLFAVAVTLVEPVVATVVFEFWPVVFGLLTLTPAWTKKMLEGEHAKDGPFATMLMMLVVGGVGVSLAVLSDTSSLGWSSAAIIGVILAVLSTFAAALSAMISQLIGTDQKNQPGSLVRNRAVAAMRREARSDVDDRSAKWDRTVVSVSGSVAGQVLAAPVIAVAGVVANSLSEPGDLWASSGLLLAVVAAATHVTAVWFFQQANHLARDAHGQTAAQINTLYYLTPVGALLLLALFADSTIDRPDLLIVGAAAVVVVNMVTHIDPEGAQRRAGCGGQGYKAFVLALWSVAAAVLLRDDWLPDGWQVWSVVEYWGLVGVFATVFTLILSFRQSRLAERRRDMDALMLRLHQQVVFMGSCRDLTEDSAVEAADLLRTVDETSDPKSLGNAYFGLRKLLIAEMKSKSDRDQAKRLSDLLADVEVLVNLRQQGRNFTELAVLAVFAFLTVVLTVAARPSGTIEPFAGWVHDTTSVVIGAVFAFLGFDLIDKRREADAPILREVTKEARAKHGQPSGWRLELVSYSDQSTDRIVAALLGAVLLIGAVAMLGVKWL